MPQEVSHHYKCISPRYPFATIAVFQRDKDGQLEFKEMVKDEEFVDLDGFPGHTSIYNNIAPGDSGGLISTKVDYRRDFRHVITAVVSFGNGLIDVANYEHEGKTPIMTKCKGAGGKVTEDIVNWIKKLNSGDYSL